MYQSRVPKTSSMRTPRNSRYTSSLSRPHSSKVRFAVNTMKDCLYFSQLIRRTSCSLWFQQEINFSSCMSVVGTRFSYLTRATKIHRPVIPVSAHEQLRHNIYSLIQSTFMADQDAFKPREVKGLKKIPPYWYPYTTMTKQRWIGRELLEVVSTEFRDRSMEYYVRSFLRSFAFA